MPQGADPGALSSTRRPSRRPPQEAFCSGTRAHSRCPTNASGDLLPHDAEHWLLPLHPASLGGIDTSHPPGAIPPGQHHLCQGGEKPGLGEETCAHSPTTAPQLKPRVHEPRVHVRLASWPPRPSLPPPSEPRSLGGSESGKGRGYDPETRLGSRSQGRHNQPRGAPTEQSGPGTAFPCLPRTDPAEVERGAAGFGPISGPPRPLLSGPGLSLPIR